MNMLAQCRDVAGRVLALAKVNKMQFVCVVDGHVGLEARMCRRAIDCTRLLDQHTASYMRPNARCAAFEIKDGKLAFRGVRNIPIAGAKT